MLLAAQFARKVVCPDRAWNNLNLRPVQEKSASAKAVSYAVPAQAQAIPSPFMFPLANISCLPQSFACQVRCIYLNTCARTECRCMGHASTVSQFIWRVYAREAVFSRKSVLSLTLVLWVGALPILSLSSRITIP